MPKRIHQTWKTAEVPAVWAPYQASWIAMHPEWQYDLWTDAANRALIAERYAWFLPVYDAFPRDIQRVDAAKYFILYTYGGVYADLDCECVKPLDPLMAHGGAIISRTPDGVIDCAMLASSPEHPFWKVAFDEMARPPLVTRLLWKIRYEASYVLFSTGTRMMKRAARRYRRQIGSGPAPGLTVLEPKFFSSRSWLDRYQPFTEEDAYVRHHYTDSWLQPGELKIHRWFTRRAASWFLAGIVVAACLIMATC